MSHVLMARASSLKASVWPESPPSDAQSNNFRSFHTQRLSTGYPHAEPNAESSKRRQLTKMIALLLVPVLALLAISSYFVAETVMINNNNEETRQIIKFSIELGEVLYMLQLERDQSVLYLSNIGPATKTYLLKQYLETDEYIYRLSMWPGELETNAYEYVRSRKAFQRHMTAHRNQLDLMEYTVFDEIEFYNTLIRIFHKWLYRILDESRYSTMWKTLVAYQKVIFARLYVGVERALGSIFFSKGGFSLHSTYESYNEAYHVFRQSFKTAQNFSSLVKPISTYDMATVSGQNLTTIIDFYRNKIRYQIMSTPSLTEARFFFDNMTTYIDIMFGIQTELAADILNLVNAKESSTLGTLALAVILVVIVVAMIPILMQALHRTTSDLQSYAIILASKTIALDKETAKADSLLHQMIPKKVAEQLKRGSLFRAMYYKSVTVFFSDLVGFTTLTENCTPVELVAMLNQLYELFDNRIERFDVYKLETIGDCYMVASGLPQKNGDRHVTEIADMSLDLLSAVQDVQVPHQPDQKMQLRIGAHTGPVVAGIVGYQLPRFCLFGETVLIASHMETTSLPSLVQISSDTHTILSKHGGYNTTPRGEINIKGKWVPTFWLMSKSSLTPSRDMQEGQPSHVLFDKELTMKSRSGDYTGKGKRKTVLSRPINDLLFAASNSGGETKMVNESPYPLKVMCAEIKTTDADPMGIAMGNRGEVGFSGGLGRSVAPSPLTNLNSEPLSYDDLVNKIENPKEGTPVVQLVEGYHY